MFGIDNAFDFAKTIINKIFKDKISEADEALITVQLESMIQQREAKLIDAQREIIVAEVKGDSWLQRNWRPILMLTIVAIVANNYLLFPYLSLFTTKVVLLTLPEKLWSLMQIGVGGYIVGRSGEKIMKNMKGKKEE